MKSRLVPTLAALAAAFAISIAHAAYVDEPAASAFNAETTDENVKAVVQELVGDASMKGSKVTVAVEDGTIILTGVTPKREQARRASEIATARAGEGKVVNAITTEEIGPPPQPAAQPATVAQPEPAAQPAVSG